jgi:branched-chain amino acid aminotransferase
MSKGISLLAMSEQVRAWPGGTGGFKLGLNYAPGFVAQRAAAALGYQQVLWLLDDTISEAGAMNVFAVFDRPDGGKSFFLLLSPSAYFSLFDPRVDLDVVTPPLDGTILPGVTRASVLSLLSHHPSTTALPQLNLNLPQPTAGHPCRRIHITERTLSISELFAASASGTLREFFCVGTAAVVIPAARIGWQRRRSTGETETAAAIGSHTSSDDNHEEDLHLQDILLPPVSEGSSLAQALWERLVDIQEGRVEWQGWSVPCESP